ncbi:hypothetical protein [Paenibacillus algorifonticola]|uniref:hypothetical protein n=1 Tax=Paenibacillus algorifonticola TaxID=684063 RepID=UPI0012E114B4|nr:hypothetical protein [Paenibacillus algorifonticola]
MIDDESQIKGYFEAIQSELDAEGIIVNIEYMNNVENFKVEKPYDIVLFDCNFNGSRNEQLDLKKEGFELIKKYRKFNKRTKIIFYSANFDLEEPDKIPFSKYDFFQIINELNIFRVVFKNDSNKVYDYIKEAIQELDVIMVSLEKMVRDYEGMDIKYNLKDGDIALEDLLYEFKMGGQVAEKFRKQLFEIILTSLSKFEM